jgi:hypothetical protein
MSQDLIFNFESSDEYNSNSVVNFYIGTSDDNLSDTDSDWTSIVSKSDNELTNDKTINDEPANDIPTNIITKSDNKTSDESTDDESTDDELTDDELTDDESTDDSSNKNYVKKITKTYYNVNNIDIDDSDYECINTSINKIDKTDISKIIIKKTITKNNNFENNKIKSAKQTTSEIKFYYN